MNFWLFFAVYLICGFLATTGTLLLVVRSDAYPQIASTALVLMPVWPVYVLWMAWYAAHRWAEAEGILHRCPFCGYAADVQQVLAHIRECKRHPLAAIVAEAGAFHPRAWKLIQKKKPFVVVAEDEPYYMTVYGMIRRHEKATGHWSEEDEQRYRTALNSAIDRACRGAEEGNQEEKQHG